MLMCAYSAYHKKQSKGNTPRGEIDDKLDKNPDCSFYDYSPHVQELRGRAEHIKWEAGRYF